MISVKELSPKEVPYIVQYWSKASDQQLDKMGADRTKVPSSAELSSMLLASLKQDIEHRNSYCLIWFDGERPIGHCNTNPTVYGDHAYMHLHLWNIEDRNKGFGTEGVKLCAPRFMEKLNLKHLYSQPKSDNNPPNEVLRKAGFRYIKKYRTTPGSINVEQEVHLWVFEAH